MAHGGDPMTGQPGSARTASTPGPASGAAAVAETSRGARALAIGAVAAGVVLLAAAAFALSYPGMHATALAGGVSSSLARLYPVIFDAMLVVSAAAILSLRSAGLPSRWFAWLCLLVLLGAAAAADALHAMGTTLPRRASAVAFAVIPWVLLLAGFSLLLAMLRHARRRRAALASPPARAAKDGRAGLDDLLGSRAAPGPPAGPADAIGGAAFRAEAPRTRAAAGSGTGTGHGRTDSAFEDVGYVRVLPKGDPQAGDPWPGGPQAGDPWPGGPQAGDPGGSGDAGDHASADDDPGPADHAAEWPAGTDAATSPVPELRRVRSSPAPPAG